jgi:hypothetical protein
MPDGMPPLRANKPAVTLSEAITKRNDCTSRKRKPTKAPHYAPNRPPRSTAPESNI